MFRQDFTCPALLKDSQVFTHTGLSPAMAGLSRPFRLSPTKPLACSAFARHY